MKQLSPNFERLRDIVGPADALELFRTLRLKRLAENEIYNSPGEEFRKVFFVLKGILRSYVLSEEGEEKTLFFRWEGHIGGAYDSIVNNQPTRLIFRAIERCELLEAEYDVFERISERSPDLMKMRLKANQKTMCEMMEKIESFVLDKPVDRYLKLVETKPEIINRVPDKHIASFIGVTPVSLSRIRSRLASGRR